MAKFAGRPPLAPASLAVAAAAAVATTVRADARADSRPPERAESLRRTHLNAANRQRRPPGSLEPKRIDRRADPDPNQARCRTAAKVDCAHPESLCITYGTHRRFMQRQGSKSHYPFGCFSLAIRNSKFETKNTYPNLQIWVSVFQITRGPSRFQVFLNDISVYILC